MDLETNPEWEKLGPLKLGDILHLKFNDTYSYKFKIILTEIDSDQMIGLIDSIFDWHSNGQILRSEINEHLGKSIAFRSMHIFKIFSQPQPNGSPSKQI